MDKINEQELAQLANYFKAMGDPTRLKVLRLLSAGRYNVGELAQQCHYSSANISRHLSVLRQQGLITRHTEGTSVYYQLTNDVPARLCELVSQRLGSSL